METLTPADPASTSTGHNPIDEEPKLDLLAKQDYGAWRPRQNAVVGSVGFHIVVLVLLLAVKNEPLAPRPPEQYFVKHVTPLYIPPELTQKAPNPETKRKDLALPTIASRPVVKSPAPSAAPKQVAATKPIPLPPAPTPQAPPKQIAAVEPPKIEAPTAPVPQTTFQQQAQLPPPPGNGPPKIALEDVSPRAVPVGQPTGRIAVPKGGVEEAVRALSKAGAGPLSVGAEITFDQGGSGPGLNLPPSLGHAQGGIQLLTNPEGVDFRPYLIQVMAAIRRNWFAVYPEAAKTGMRGEVIVQFRVAKQGVVAKVVFNGQSPSRPLNEAAVSAISASNPFPPLPTEFKGDHVDLQMRFLYNMQR